MRGGDEPEYKPRNRTKAKTAKPGVFWCHKCDRNHVGQTGKCQVCGHRENRKKIRDK